MYIYMVLKNIYSIEHIYMIRVYRANWGLFFGIGFVKEAFIRARRTRGGVDKGNFIFFDLGLHLGVVT